MLRRVLLVLSLLLALGGAYVLFDWWWAVPSDAVATYVGSQECRRCHEPEFDLWHGSDHDRAMEPATPETVLGNFDDQEFTHFGQTSKFFRRDDKFFVTTDNADGKQETFEVKYTFGYRPLQQYLVEFPDGRLQCLPLTWDTEAKRWYHLYPNEAIPAGDELHWTGPLQNWNYMCAACHSTNLQKNYDLASNTYHTTWSEIDVSCETCHGPGSIHVQLSDASSFFWDRRVGFGLPNLKSDDPHVEIETCAPCHSRRRIVYPGFQAGDRFLDYYYPELLNSNLYYADGQILEEDYVYGSFIQSKMYAKGVRCSDCHDPHSMRIKDRDPDAPWWKITNNKVCTDCHMGQHPAGKYDTPTHHHHPDSSKPGTLCVECHAPETSYMVVDPRRDHSFRNPRPDLTVSLDIPNACTGCHHDESKGETAEWAEEKLREWYGPRKGPKHFAYAIAAGREVKPEGEPLLEAVLRRTDISGSVRASCLLLLARYPSAVVRPEFIEALKHPDALVRTAAVRALGEAIVPDTGEGRAELARWLGPMVGDSIRSVRTEAARVLAVVPKEMLAADDREAFDRALEEYILGQKSVGDQAAAHLNLAVLYMNLGRIKEAEKQYTTALRLDSKFVPARINLAMLYDQQGKKDEAARLFREVIELRPDMAEAYYSLGLLMAEKKDQLEEAAKLLGKAAALAPDRARIHYNYGLALQQLDRPEEAEQQLKTAYELEPETPDFLHALTIFYSQQKRWPRAIACAEELVRRFPQNPQMHSLLEYVRQQAGE